MESTAGRESQSDTQNPARAKAPTVISGAKSGGTSTDAALIASVASRLMAAQIIKGAQITDYFNRENAIIKEVNPEKIRLFIDAARELVKYAAV